MKAVTSISIDRPLLDEVDTFAASNHAPRSWAVSRLIRAGLEHEPMRHTEPRRPIAGDQPRSPNHE